MGEEPDAAQGRNFDLADAVRLAEIRRFNESSHPKNDITAAG